MQETQTHKNATAAKIMPGLKKEKAAFQTRDEYMREEGNSAKHKKQIRELQWV